MNTQSKLEDLRARRAELQRDLAKAAEAIEAKKRSVGADVLAGKSNDAGIDALAREQLRVAALEEALGQADSQIGELESQIRQAEIKQHRERFDAKLAEVESVIIDGLAGYLAFEAALNTVDDRLQELVEAGVPYISPVTGHDGALIAMRVREMLVSLTQQTSVVNMLQNMESQAAYRRFLEAAREKVKV